MNEEQAQDPMVTEIDRATEGGDVTAEKVMYDPPDPSKEQRPMTAEEKAELDAILEEANATTELSPEQQDEQTFQKQKQESEHSRFLRESSVEEQQEAPYSIEKEQEHYDSKLAEALAALSPERRSEVIRQAMMGLGEAKPATKRVDPNLAYDVRARHRKEKADADRK